MTHTQVAPDPVPDSTPLSAATATMPAMTATIPEKKFARVPDLSSTADAIASIRDRLREYAPEFLPQFEDDLRAAVHILLRHTNHEPVNRVLYEWNLHAYSVEHPLTEEEQAALDRALKGDFTGFIDRTDEFTNTR